MICAKNLDKLYLFILKSSILLILLMPSEYIISNTSSSKLLTTKSFSGKNLNTLAFFFISFLNFSIIALDPFGLKSYNFILVFCIASMTFSLLINFSLMHITSLYYHFLYSILLISF